MDQKTIEDNKRLCERYPFLIPRSVWDGDIINGYDYSFTELDSLPSGWRKAFGEQMCEELRDILIKGDYLDYYRITDIKEKYGILMWYDGGIPSSISDEYYKWLHKYEDLSCETCISCGDKATHITKGWINYMCKNCVEKLKLNSDPLGDL